MSNGTNSFETLLGLIVIVGIAWLIIRSRRKKRAAADAKNAQLIALQNVVSSTKSDRLMLSAAQLRRATINYVSGQNRDMTAAVERLQRAEDPKAFFDQLDKIGGVIDKLQSVYDVMPDVIQPSPADMRAEVERSLGGDIDGMIDRAWQKAQLEAAKVVKADTKAAKYTVYFQIMDVFAGRMKPENLEHLRALKTSVGL